MSAYSFLDLFDGYKSYYQHRADWGSVYKEEGFGFHTCVFDIKETIHLDEGETLDGGNCLFRWRAEGWKSKCHSSTELSEEEDKMFVMARNSRIKNMHIECALEGILMNDNTRIENVVMRDCEEECITTRGTKNVIKNNRFYLCQDKCIQLSGAKNVYIENNLFKHAYRPISGKDDKRGADKPVYVRNNRCKNCEIMIRGQKDHKIFAGGNSLIKGECLFETMDQSVIYDEGKNSVVLAEKLCEDGTKNIRATKSKKKTKK